MARSHNKAVIAAMLLCVGLSSVHAETKKLYRWVDENGRVNYGDRVPPAEAKQGRDTIGKNGVVTKSLPRELQGAELAEAEAQLAARKAIEDARKKRILDDNNLLMSYNSTEAIEMERNERLLAIDGRIALAESTVKNTEKTLVELRQRAKAANASAELKAQVSSFEDVLIDSVQGIHKLRDDRKATEERFTQHIERYKGLRSGAIRKGD